MDPDLYDSYVSYTAEQYELAETVGATAAHIKATTIDRTLSMPKAVALAERQLDVRLSIEAIDWAIAEGWKNLPERQESRRRAARDRAREAARKRDRERVVRQHRAKYPAFYEGETFP